MGRTVAAVRSLERRLVRRRTTLDALGLFVWPAGTPGLGHRGLQLPIRLMHWGKSVPDPAHPKHVAVPDAFIPWLEPEELRWVQSLVMADRKLFV